MRPASVLLIALFAGVTSAGGYGTVRLSADAAGVVRLRGPNVQGVDWHAAGKSAVDVPVYVYNDVPSPLTVDGVPFGGAVRSVDATADVRPVFDEDAYQQAFVWQPGPTPAVTRWALGATAVIALTLLVARFIDPKRATRWTVLTAGGLTAGVVWLFPADAPRRTISVPGNAGREWVWYAGRGAGEANEPWSPGLRFVPRSAEHLRAAEPVARCDAAGRVAAVHCRIENGGRAVFVRDSR